MPRLRQFIDRLRKPDLAPVGVDAGASATALPAQVRTVTRHGALLRRIKLAYGMDAASFERDILPLVDRYATFVHLLPATADNYFSRTGGLFELGLEIGFYALQGTDGQIFSGRASISTRRELEPRWRLATFIAGLCHELHRTLSHLAVTDAHGETWPAYMQPLRTWLRMRRSEHYEIHWVPLATEVRSLGVFALPHIVPTETLQHLAHANSIIVPDMMASIAGMASHLERNVPNEIVLRAASLVIEGDLHAMRERSGRSIAGEHVSRYLIHVLRQLVASNATWRPNAEKSRTWFAQDGFFLVWPGAAIDMQRLMDGERFRGLPERPREILGALVAAGIAHAPNNDAGTWLIYPPGSQAPVEAIRIRAPELLFENAIAPAVLSIRLLAPPSSSGAQAALDLVPAVSSPPSTAAPLESAPPAEPVGASSVLLRLNAPARLDPSIRKALDEVVASMPASEATGSKTPMEPQGLFIPLTQLSDRALDPAVVVRALDALGMLSRRQGAAKTSVRTIEGKTVPGFVLAAKFIAGGELAPAMADLFPSA